MSARRNRRLALATGLALGLTGLLPVTSAGAVNTAQSHLVSAVPSTATPDINNGTVFALTQVGTRIVAGGTFSSVSPHGSSTTVARTDIVAWDAATGAIDAGFAPTLDGEVEDLTPGPLPNTVYAAGYFNNVNGVRVKGVALLDLTTGKVVTGWKPAAINGAVYGVRLSNGRLLVGGTFTTVGGAAHSGLASLNPTTGALDPYVNVQLTGHHNYTGAAGQADGAVGPRALDVSPDGRRLVAIGNFKTANGLPRDQIVMVDLDGPTAVVDPNWATLGYTAACFSGAFDTYMRDVDFSPDGSYFAVVATGGSGTNVDGTNSLCDTAARWETGATGANVRPTWAIWTGQDTLASVAITGSVVYVGGHQRWLNNSHGYDYPGEGAVPRPGLAALDPRNGMPFSWNPGRNPRGAGAFALLATSTGLYVGSDTEWIGNYAYKRKRVAYFPLAGGASATEAATPALPGKVFLAGGFNGNSNVLYRVDAGGPALLSSDGGPDWAADQSDPSPYRNSGSNSASWDPVPKVDATVPAGTPSAIFDTERWDPGDANEMHWSFPVPAGTSVDVRLYFANRCSCTSGVGQRVFNVSIDGQSFLSNFDIVAAVGDQTGTMRDKVLTSDGSVDIDFGHVTENPLVNGIEIVKTGTAPGGSGDLDSLRSRTFDGTTAGATANLTTAIQWRHVRGAFEVGNTLFYGWDDGNLYKRTFDGTTFGAATLIDPYDDPAWANVATGTKDGNGNPVLYRGTKPDLYSQMSSVTGMAYRDGVLYYTRFGDSRLFSRYFLPDSGIVGSDTVVAPGGVNMSNVSGMFLSGGFLYWASKVDGSLHRDAFDHGALSGDTVVSGPAQDGNDWRARALFVDSNGATANQPPTARITNTCSNLSCSFSGSTSTDDGTISGYTWNFGDGATATGATPSHTYAAPGTYTVTLTVTDNGGLTGTATKSVTVSAANQPPTATISNVSCTGLACSFDGTGSSDADGTVASYAWTFGDGATSTAAKPSHTYAAAGTYTVTLTVTDDKNASDSTTTTVSPTSGQSAAIGFVGAGSANSNNPTKTVTVPASVRAGDALLLMLSKNSTVTTSAPTGSGWVSVDSLTNGSMVTQVWKKVATASDASTTVSITQPGYGQADLELLAYTGTSTTNPVASFAKNADSVTTATHTTPTAPVSTTGSWAVSYWTDKSSSTTGWTAPGSVTTRATSIGTGSGRMTALVADSGGPVSGSSYGGLTATTNQASARAEAWTLVLAPR